MSTPYPGNPNWPAEFSGCTVHAHYIGSDGLPITGTVDFMPDAKILLDYPSNITVVPRKRTATIGPSGQFTLQLPATDDPDISPVRWTYQVTENFPGGQTFHIEAPSGATVELTQATPVPSSMGTPITKGDRGDAGSVTQVEGQNPDGSGHVDLGDVVLLRENNLRDLTNVFEALTALELGSAARQSASYFAQSTDMATALASIGALGSGLSSTNTSLGSTQTQVAGILSGLGGVVPDLITDWNAATAPGLYTGTSTATHGPAFQNAFSSGLSLAQAAAYTGLVLPRSGDGMLTQVVWRVASTAKSTEVWVRQFTGVWQPWVCIFFDTDWDTSGAQFQALPGTVLGNTRIRRVGNRIKIMAYTTVTPGATSPNSPISVNADGTLSSSRQLFVVGNDGTVFFPGAGGLGVGYSQPLMPVNGQLAAFHIDGSGTVWLDAVSRGASFANGTGYAFNVGGTYLVA